MVEVEYSSHRTPDIFLPLFHPHCVLLLTAASLSPLLCMQSASQIHVFEFNSASPKKGSVHKHSLIQIERKDGYDDDQVDVWGKKDSPAQN